LFYLKGSAVLGARVIICREQQHDAVGCGRLNPDAETGGDAWTDGVSKERN